MVVTPTAFTMTWTDSYGGTTVWDHAGDCTTVPFKQIVVAMGAGSTAALSAFDHLIRTRDLVAV